MKGFVPITKILLTAGTAVWALVLQQPENLAILSWRDSFRKI